MNDAEKKVIIKQDIENYVKTIRDLDGTEHEITAFYLDSLSDNRELIRLIDTAFMERGDTDLKDISKDDYKYCMINYYADKVATELHNDDKFYEFRNKMLVEPEVKTGEELLAELNAQEEERIFEAKEKEIEKENNKKKKKQEEELEREEQLAYEENIKQQKANKKQYNAQNNQNDKMSKAFDELMNSGLLSDSQINDMKIIKNVRDVISIDSEEHKSAMNAANYLSTSQRSTYAGKKLAKQFDKLAKERTKVVLNIDRIYTDYVKFLEANTTAIVESNIGGKAKDISDANKPTKENLIDKIKERVDDVKYNGTRAERIAKKKQEQENQKVNSEKLNVGKTKMTANTESEDKTDSKKSVNAKKFRIATALIAKFSFIMSLGDKLKAKLFKNKNSLEATKEEAKEMAKEMGADELEKSNKESKEVEAAEVSKTEPEKPETKTAEASNPEPEKSETKTVETSNSESEKSETKTVETSNSESEKAEIKEFEELKSEPEKSEIKEPEELKSESESDNSNEYDGSDDEYDGSDDEYDGSDDEEVNSEPVSDVKFETKNQRKVKMQIRRKNAEITEKEEKDYNEMGL